jgi:hypothetical protein
VFPRDENGAVILARRAHFTKYPSRIEDLKKPYLLEDQTDYTIVKVISLNWIDYGNFVTDMTVERSFLEKNAPLCRARNDHSLPCVLVRQLGRDDGILVVPDELGYVILASYVKNITLERKLESGVERASK